jgi:hypothetical protein
MTNELKKQSVLETEEDIHLTLDGELNISDYVQEVKPTQDTIQDVCHWTNKQRETTRTRLAMWLVKGFGCSLGLTFMLMGVAAFNPNADKALIKDLIPQIITPQVTLLGVALGFYFATKEE